MASPSKDATPMWDIMSPEDDKAIMEKFTAESNKVIKRWSLGSASFAEKDAAVSFLVQLGAVQITMQSGSQQTAAQKQVSILFGDEDHKKTDQERDEADPGDTKDAIPSGWNSFTPAPVFLDQDTKEKSETPISLDQDTKEKSEVQINYDDDDENNNYSMWMTEPDDGDDDDNQIPDPAPVVENSSATRPRKEHPCPDCHMVLHSMWELDLHKLRSCINKTPNHVYNCDQCSKSFSMKVNAVTHLRKVHNMSPTKAFEKLADLKSTERQNRRKVSESKEMRITSNKQSTKSSHQRSSKSLRSKEKTDNYPGRKSKISKVALRKERDSRNMQGAKQQKQSGPKRRVGKRSHQYSEENEPQHSKRLCIRLQPLANGWIKILESETVYVNKLTSNSLSNEPNKTAVVSNDEIPKSIHTSNEHQNLNCNTESDKPSPMSESEPLDINEEREASAGIPIQADATENSGRTLTALKSDELQDHGPAEQVGEKHKEHLIPMREAEPLIADRETEKAEIMPMPQNSEAAVEEDHGRKLMVLPSEGCTGGQIREESQDASTTSQIERDRQRSNSEINEIHEWTCEPTEPIEKKNLRETIQKETKEVNSVGVSDHDNNVTTSPKSTENKKISRTCKICDLQFKSNYQRRQHVLKIHREDVQEYKCSTCNRPFMSKEAFTAHLKTHMDINDREKYCCKICNETFISKYVYQKHMKSHVDKPEAFKCDTCGTVLASKRSLERHINSKHIKEIVYTCEVCGKNFYITANIKEHLDSHKERTWKCDECGAAFFNENGLKVHRERVHTASAGKCLCEICGSAFKTPGNLKQHILTAHTDVYKFSCDVCGKKFKRSSHRNSHMKMHSNDPKDKPFKCEICNKCFRVAGKLKVHMDWHYNIRSHTCDVCDKSFLTKGNLDKHKYVHLGKRPHECRICSVGFLDLPGLRKHLDVKHKITLKKVVMKGVQSERIAEGSAANGLPAHELENRPSSPSTSVSDCDDRLVVGEAGHQESSTNVAQVSEASGGQIVREALLAMMNH